MAARVSLTSTELKAAKACTVPTSAAVKLRDPQSGDLISVSFPAALATSEENMPATPAQIQKSVSLGGNNGSVLDTRQGTILASCSPGMLGAAGRA